MKPSEETEAPFSEVNAEGDTKVSAQTAAEDTAVVAKQKASEAWSEAQTQARETGKTLQNQALSSLDQGRRELAQRASGLSRALRESRSSLDGHDLPGVAHYTDRAAGAVEEVTNYLQERDSQDLLLDLEKAAKREPLLVYGGLFAVGALTVWALKGTQKPQAGVRRDKVRVSEPVPTTPEAKATAKDTGPKDKDKVEVPHG